MKKRLLCSLMALLSLCCLFAACNKEGSAPDGMKDAAVKDAEYHLYVPETWVLNNEGGVSGAYVSATERSNVTCTSFLPDRNMSAQSFFEDVCLPQYQNGTLVNFQLLEELCTDTTLGGLNAKKYVYIYSLGGADYETMQVVVSAGNMVYNLTYTATAATYGDHLEDVELIISHFTFK